MKIEKHFTQSMVNIKGQLEVSDSFKALLVVYLPQVIASIGILLIGVVALICC